MYVKSYKELIVWQKSMKLVKDIFVLTKAFPQAETYGLISQMRRASVAVPSNIAEGYGRKSTRSHIQFYAIAYGSALELETQLIISKDLGYMSEEDFTKINDLLSEVCKMLNAMIAKMKSLPNS